MSKNIFITGIGTEVGKTIAAAIATQALKADYWKPIQSGELENTDTDKIKKLVDNSSSHFFDEAYKLTQALSPHASANYDGITIDLEKIKRPKTTNNLVIEGAGGLLVPLNNKNTIADLILPNDKIILVAKHYLGSINHTLLSYNFLINKGFKDIAIWINGAENTSTEQALKHMTSAFFIERIDDLKIINSVKISSQADKIHESLSAFLQWNG